MFAIVTGKPTNLVPAGGDVKRADISHGARGKKRAQEYDALLREEMLCIVGGEARDIFKEEPFKFLKMLCQDG